MKSIPVEIETPTFPSLKQRCPTKFLRSPHLWRINMFIGKIPKNVQCLENILPGPSLFRFFELFSRESVKSHSPHLSGHSPHVASGEWVGKRWFKGTQLKVTWPTSTF